jgi:signal transduction histidine kinase
LIEGTDIVSKAEAGAGAEGHEPVRIKLGQGCWGWVAQSGEPLLVPDVGKDPRCRSDPDPAEVCSRLCVPLKTKENVFGVLSAESNHFNAFDESDQLVLLSIANQAAVAVENIRFYERAQQLAVSEERNRLARELHDAVTQTLFSASLLAEALPATWENDYQEGRELLYELRGLSRGALAEMRTLLLELRPAALVETRLEDLLRQLGEAASGREGIPVSILIERKPEGCDYGELPEDVHITFYRIAQEALNNVVKHARANKVVVRLCVTSGGPEFQGERSGLSVLLSIKDDGRGFDPTCVAATHFGLGIMHERALAIGASLNLESQPGEGTQVALLWEQHETRQAR